MKSKEKKLKTMLIRFKYKTYLITFAKFVKGYEITLFISFAVFLFLYCNNALILNLFVSQNDPSDVVYFDDSNVNSDHYLYEYRDRLESIAYLMEERNVENKKYKTIINHRRKSTGKSSYSIIMYTDVFGTKKLCTGDEDLFLKECPFKNCNFSCDRDQASNADAIIFSERDLSMEDRETYYKINSLLQYSENREDQVWILWNDEPTISPKMNKFHFNWTMSYRIDAEVSDCSYGCSYAIHNKKENQLELFINEYRLNFYKRKSKALWGVSNCKATKRMNFAIRLNKFFPVKVLGRCADYFANPNSLIPLFIRDWFFVNKTPQCGRNSKCENELFSKSKFYLSLESKNCTDYLTEKIWRVLRTNMIPIVFQPSKENYNQIVPPLSFIHAQDFDYDAKRLAQYLNVVSTDFRTYLKHHAWRFDYDVVYTAKHAEKRRLCELCSKLNTETSLIYYNKISEWFDRGCHK